MSLRDYEVPRDKFTLAPDVTVGLTLTFPCCHCGNRNRKDDSEPCRTCDHNVNAVKDGAVREKGEVGNEGRPRHLERCALCHKSKGFHKADTLHCPSGMKTRVGYIHYSATDRYTQKIHDFLPKSTVGDDGTL